MAAMDEGMMRERVLAELRGGLWHTTHPDRFKCIMETGAILTASETSNPDGWKTYRRRGS